MMLSGPATDVSYSPDGKYLVSADGNRKGTQIWMALVNTTLEIKFPVVFKRSITFCNYYFSDFIQSR